MIDRVLLVNPRGVSKGLGSNSLWVPVGIADLASHLQRHSLDVKVVDLCIGQSYFGIRQLLRTLRDWQPGVIGFSGMTPTFDNTVKTARNLRTAISGEGETFGIAKDIIGENGIEGYSPIFVNGGPHTTFKTQDVLQKHVLDEMLFDYIVAGEGEYRFTKLIESLNAGETNPEIQGVYSKERGLMDDRGKYRRVNVDDLTFPAFDLLKMRSYIQASKSRIGFKALEMVVSRGCPYICAFCSSTDANVKYIPVEKVIENIKAMKAKYNIEGVWFKDSTFTTNREWTMEFCEAAEKLNREISGPALKYAASTRIDRMDDGLFTAMSDANFAHLFFGIESGSYGVLNTLRKYSTTSGSGSHNEKALEAFEKCEEHGMGATAYFMIGTPGERIDDIRQSVSLAEELKAANSNSDIFWRVYNPLPGSELYTQLVSEERIGGEDLNLAYHKVPQEYPYGFDAPGILSNPQLGRLVKELILFYEKGGPKPELEKYVKMGLTSNGGADRTANASPRWNTEDKSLLYVNFK